MQMFSFYLSYIKNQHKQKLLYLSKPFTNINFAEKHEKNFILIGSAPRDTERAGAVCYTSCVSVALDTETRETDPHNTNTHRETIGKERLYYNGYKIKIKWESDKVFLSILVYH